MRKRQIHAYIGDREYILIQQKNINASELIRNLLRDYFKIDHVETDRDKVLQEIHKLEDSENSVKEKLAQARMKLFIIEEEERKKEDEDLENKEKVVLGLKSSGWMHEVGQ